MPTSPMSEIIRYLRSLQRLPEEADLTDGQLLDCYVSRRESAALEALVRRHGPMVWGVCSRILQNHHDAEDAFQATFLVLARKAASIRWGAKVGNWLYGVAHQTALKARATRAKRKMRERQVENMPEPAMAEQDGNDLQAVLDQELSCLPEKYRTVVVLCELEGKTVRDAARHLGCPEGTVASRLARGRALLAKRLARHGLAVTGATLATVLSQKAASASVPTAVLSSTIKALSLAAAGEAASGVISGTVAALTEGVIKAMLLNKLMKTTAVVLLFAALSSAAGMIYQAQAAGPKSQVKGDGVEKPAATARGEDKQKKDEELIQGTWVAVSAEADGQQAPEEAIKDFTLVITADKLIFPGNRQSSYKLDPTKTPKVIAVTPLDGPRKGQAMNNIYRLDGDRLSLCLQNGDGDAPTEFATKVGDGLRLLILKRKTEDADKEKQSNDDRAGLQGTWRLVTSEADGVTIGEGRDELKDVRLVIEKTSITMTGKVIHDPRIKKEPEDMKAVGTLTLDTRKDPKQIVFTWEANPVLSKEDLIQRGIYALDGDDLKLCFYFPGSNTKGLVPTEFSAPAGSKRSLGTWKRVPPPAKEEGIESRADTRPPPDLSKIQPPGGVPLDMGRPGTPIKVDGIERARKRLEAVPREDLEKWIVELERLLDQKLKDGIPSTRQACRTDFVIHLSLAFDDLKWNPKAADKLFQRAQTMPASEVKAWKEAFEALLKKKIGQTDTEVLDGGPAWAVPLVLIPVDALHDGQKYSAERGKKYQARLKELTAEDVSLWIDQVDQFGGTKLDAAVNIVLLDDFFVKEKFQRDKFKAAVERQQAKKNAPTDEADEKEKLQGTWQLVSFEADGLRVGESRPELKDDRLVIGRESLTFFAKTVGKPRMEADFTLDITRIPKVIVLKCKDDKKVVVRKAIYAVQGNNLKLCMSAHEEKEAPTEFSAKAGSERVLWTFKRVPPADKEGAKKDPQKSQVSETQKELHAKTPAAEAADPDYLVEFRRLQAEMKELMESLEKKYGAAKSQEEREAAMAPVMRSLQEKGAPLADKALALVRPHAADKEAVEILTWILNQEFATSMATSAAAELLAKHHLHDSQTLDTACRFQRAPMRWTEPLLQKLADADLPPDRKVRALVSLAECAKTRAELPGMLKELDATMRSVVEVHFGKEYLTELRRADPARAEAEAIRRFEELVQKYGTQKYGTGTVKDHAEGALFEMRHLVVGKEAPDIEGEDIDGNKFRLSDYRGKVVLLDFWGHW